MPVKKHATSLCEERPDAEMPRAWLLSDVPMSWRCGSRMEPDLVEFHQRIWAFSGLEWDFTNENGNSVGLSGI